MTDLEFWAQLRRDYPAMFFAGGVLATLVFLIINFVWLRIMLPDLINAQSDGLLLTAVAGSLLLVCTDLLVIGSAIRFLDQVEAASKREEHNEDA